MKRNTLNLLVDLASALVMFGIVATGLLIRYVLPPGSGHSKTLWTWSRHEWGDVHFWIAVAAGVLLLVHVALHWQWVCVTTMRLVRRAENDRGYPGGVARNLAGIVLMACLIGFFIGFVWVAQTQVQTVSGSTEHQDHVRVGQPGRSSGSHDEEQAIRGSMTLNEVAAISGMSVETLRTRLGLPAGVSPDERLGQLRQRHGLTMEKIREIVAAAQEGRSSSQN